jgi:hypothetical protein
MPEGLRHEPGLPPLGALILAGVGARPPLADDELGVSDVAPAAEAAAALSAAPLEASTSLSDLSYMAFENLFVARASAYWVSNSLSG